MVGKTHLNNCEKLAYNSVLLYARIQHIYAVLLEFFLNEVELSLNSVNSANSEKLIKSLKHESGSI